MRVGASVRQHARIKRMHAEGTPAFVIAKTIQMTDQSLEKILAHLDGREEVTLALQDNPEVAAMRSENAALLARLAKYEEPQDGPQTESSEVPRQAESEESGGAEGSQEGQENKDEG